MTLLGARRMMSTLSTSMLGERSLGRRSARGRCCDWPTDHTCFVASGCIAVHQHPHAEQGDVRQNERPTAAYIQTSRPRDGCSSSVRSPVWRFPPGTPILRQRQHRRRPSAVLVRLVCSHHASMPASRARLRTQRYQPPYVCRTAVRVQAAPRWSLDDSCVNIRGSSGRRRTAPQGCDSPGFACRPGCRTGSSRPISYRSRSRLVIVIQAEVLVL